MTNPNELLEEIKKQYELSDTDIEYHDDYVNGYSFYYEGREVFTKRNIVDFCAELNEVLKKKYEHIFSAGELDLL
jgi:hypothetical protein